MKTKIAKWVAENTPKEVAIVGDLDYRGADRKEDCGLIESVAWFRKTYPQYAYHAFHPANEFKASKDTFTEYYQRIKKGQIDGLCDFILLSPRLGTPNLMIEFKRQNIGKSLSLGKSENAKQSRDRLLKQLEILSVHAKTGAECYLCLDSPNSINFKKIIKNYCNKFSL